MRFPLAKRHVVELLGMLFVLLSAGYQVFLVAPSQSQASDESLLNIRQRVDTVWTYIGQYSHLISDTEKDAYDRYQLHNDLSAQYFQFDKENAWQTIADTDSKIAGVMFMLGSLLLLISRYLELAYKPHGDGPKGCDQRPNKSSKRTRKRPHVA